MPSFFGYMLWSGAGADPDLRPRHVRLFPLTGAAPDAFFFGASSWSENRCPLFRDDARVNQPFTIPPLGLISWLLEDIPAATPCPGWVAGTIWCAASGKEASAGMRGVRELTRDLCVFRLATALAFGLLAGLTAGPASAQGLFGLIFGGGQRAAAPSSRPAGRERLSGPRPVRRRAPGRALRPAPARAVAYCVRTMRRALLPDPAPRQRRPRSSSATRSARPQDPDLQRQPDRSCGRAERQRYADLDNAFVYRQRLVDWLHPHGRRTPSKPSPRSISRAIRRCKPGRLRRDGRQREGGTDRHGGKQRASRGRDDRTRREARGRLAARSAAKPAAVPSRKAPVEPGRQARKTDRLLQLPDHLCRRSASDRSAPAIPIPNRCTRRGTPCSSAPSIRKSEAGPPLPGELGPNAGIVRHQRTVRQLRPSTCGTLA